MLRTTDHGHESAVKQDDVNRFRCPDKKGSGSEQQIRANRICIIEPKPLADLPALIRLRALYSRMMETPTPAVIICLTRWSPWLWWFVTA